VVHGQSRAYVTLAMDEAFPDTVSSRDAQTGLQSPEGVGLVAETQDVLDEGPEFRGAETRTSKGLHEPDAESMTTTGMALPTVGA